jgi:hypothetical protein
MDRIQLANVEVRSAPPHDHAVHVYADDRAICQEIFRFIEAGLVLGEGVIVAANDQHRAAIADWRWAHLSKRENESLLVVDAAETLRTFMLAGGPDQGLFKSSVGVLVERAGRDGRRVRAFGEMVALLWADGNVTGALELESLWNDMASKRQFFLLCGYPEGLLDDAPLHTVNAMCHRHSDLSLLGHQIQFAEATTATSSRARRLLIPTPTAVPAARQVTIRTLIDWGLSHLIERCMIIISELALNAVRHARSSFRLTLSRDSTRLRIAVEDAVAGLPVANPWAAGSRRSGLARVESIASDVGCDVTPDGKTVWAEVALG